MTKLRLISIVAISLVLIASSFVAFELFTVRDSTERLVKVQAGDNAGVIGNKLKREGIVRSSSAFRMLAKLRGADRSLKPGTYVFGGHSNLWNTVSRLAAGHSENIRITSPRAFHASHLPTIADSGLRITKLASSGNGYISVRRLTGYPLASLEGFSPGDLSLPDIEQSG
jgi:UPF0755 protein